MVHSAEYEQVRSDELKHLNDHMLKRAQPQDKLAMLCEAVALQCKYAWRAHVYPPTLIYSKFFEHLFSQIHKKWRSEFSLNKKILVVRFWHW